MEIKNCTLFNNITKGELISLMDKVHYRIRKYRKDEIIVFNGTKNEDLRIILSGSAKTEMISDSKVINIAKLNSGSPLAIAFIFGSNNYFPVNVIAEEDVEIIEFPKQELIKMIGLNENFMINFLQQLSNQTQFLAKRLQFLNLNTIKEKLLLYIRDLSIMSKDEWIKLDKTQQQLADYFGVGRPSLARSFGELVDENRIEINSKKLIRLIR